MEFLGSDFGFAAAAILGGALLGVAAHRGRFCTLGAIEDAAYAQEWARARMWALSIALSILVVFTLSQFGVLSLKQTVFGQTSWNPLASLIGGVVFGYGMAIAGSCGLTALARAASGDLRSFVIVMVMGVSAYIAMSGPLAAPRVALFPMEAAAPDAPASLAHWIGGGIGLPAFWPALLIALAFAVWALRDAEFRVSARAWAACLAVAAAISTGWVASTAYNAENFHSTPIMSHTFTGPIGDTLFYAMTSSGGGISFGVYSVIGVLAGAAVSSRLSGRDRWEACDDPRELGRQIFGAFLMGVGGVIALGCSIGQGLTAFSTLAPSAPVTALAIILGARLGLRQLIEGASPTRSLSGLFGVKRPAK